MEGIDYGIVFCYMFACFGSFLFIDSIVYKSTDKIAMSVKSFIANLIAVIVTVLYLVVSR